MSESFNTDTKSLTWTFLSRSEYLTDNKQKLTGTRPVVIRSESTYLIDRHPTHITVSFISYVALWLQGNPFTTFVGRFDRRKNTLNRVPILESGEYVRYISCRHSV